MARTNTYWRIGVVGLAFSWFLATCLARISLGLESEGNMLAEFPIDGFNGILTVPVTFRSVDYNFWIDTGSATTNLVPQLSWLLVKSSREARLAGAERTVTVPVYRSPEGRIANLRLPPLENVSCLDEGLNHVMSLNVHGSLGIDAMRAFVVRIDYDRAKLAFLRSVPPDSGRRLQLSKQIACPSIWGAVGGQKQMFILDTGCILFGAGTLPTHDFSELITRGDLFVAESLPSWSAFHKGDSRAGVVGVPIVVAGYTHRGLAFVENHNPERSENTLGSGFLRRYVVTFDFPNNAVYFAPGASVTQLDASHDSGGLRLARERDRVVVCTVARRGPASIAGIRVTDVLMEIDGKSAGALDDITLVHLLSRVDHPIEMVFARPSDGVSIRFVHDERALRERVLNSKTGSAQQESPPSKASERQRGGERAKWWNRFRRR